MHIMLPLWEPTVAVDRSLVDNGCRGVNDRVSTGGGCAERRAALAPVRMVDRIGGFCRALIRPVTGLQAG
jgi:hypothetical protein